MKKSKTLFFTIALAVPGLSPATPIMPDFAEIPTGWITDRYDPASFSNVGTFEGRDNVLGITINSTTSSANRLSGQQGSFYDTQGKKHALTGGAGSVLSADLFVADSWRDSANGHIRTDMWGVMTNGSSITNYPIVGFTNFGDGARFRYYDSSIAAWTNLGDSVLFGSWNSLAMEFTGTGYNYYINGSLAASLSPNDGTTGFQDVIMQAFNFDGNTTGAIIADYTAHWSNTQLASVPDSGVTVLLLGLSLIGISAIRRRLG